MSDVVTRPYAGEADYELMRSLLRGAYAEVGPDVAMTLGDLDYWRFQSEDADAEMTSCRLWLDDTDGSLVGFAWPGDGDGDTDGEAGAAVIDLLAHPHRGEVLDPMLAWAEGWLSRRGTARSIAVNGLEADDGLTAVLARRGYTRTGSFSHWYRVRALDRPIPEGGVAGGYTLRCADPRDAPMIAHVNNRSGAGPALTAASCRAIMGAPTYDPELHLVVEAHGKPDVAAFCIIWYDDANRVGLLEPVACHPDHHRRGLATAMLSEGLRRLWRRGATEALVATGGGNEPANQLYASLGFEVRGRSWRWVKRGWRWLTCRPRERESTG